MDLCAEKDKADDEMKEHCSKWRDIIMVHGFEEST